MPKVDHIAELAGKLLHALEQQRQSDGDYPLTVARLAALADPQATPEQVTKALGKKPFVARWIAASKKDANSPIVLAEDAEHLAASPLLLEFALGLVCSAEKPLHIPSKAVNKVDKALRPAFKVAIGRQVAENTLPATVGVRMVRGKPQLYLTKFPPTDPIEELSKKLVQTLIEQRERGADAYPVPLNRLIEQTGVAANSTVRKQALSREPFRSQAVLAMPSLPDTPVALVGDSERLASSPALLHHVLNVVRTADNQAIAFTDLKKKIGPGLQAVFVESVNRRLADGVFPDGIGVLRVKKKPLIFFFADIPVTPPPRIEPKPPPNSADFAQLFDEAFARLEREHGSHNHVNLTALRRAVPMERAFFDAELQQLRRDGRYSLSAAEGRHGISAEERDAGIHEDGSLLLFVSRREVG